MKLLIPQDSDRSLAQIDSVRSAVELIEENLKEHGGTLVRLVDVRIES